MAAAGFHHMTGQSLDIGYRTMLHTRDIAVAHQRHPVAVEGYNTVYHIMKAVGPRQHDVAHLQTNGALQNNTVATAGDERQHAAAPDGESHADALVHHSYGFFYYYFVLQCLILTSFLPKGQ